MADIPEVSAPRLQSGEVDRSNQLAEIERQLRELGRSRAFEQLSHYLTQKRAPK
jgi:hypothetical protein